MSAGLTKRRIARKQRRCGCGTLIQVGHAYLEHTLFPGNDVFDIDKPMRLHECGDCAHRYGRELLVEPWPEDQERRYWLGDAAPTCPDPIEAAR